MKCNEEALSAYIDHELDAEAHAEIEQHLTECSACTETLATLKHTQTRLRENCEDADLHTTVIQRVRRAEEVLGKNQRRRLPFGVVGAAAAILLLALAGYAYVVMSNRPVDIVETQTPSVPLQPPTETARNEEPTVEAPPEPIAPDIVEAVAPMEEESPATPAPPMGYWNAVMTVQMAEEEEPQIGEMSATFSHSNGEITLVLENSMDMEGTLNGHDATFKGEPYEGMRYALRGTFNPAYTVFKGTGSFTHDKYPRNNSQFEIYATQLSDVDSKPFELAALFDERKGEVYDMADVLVEFAESNDNKYPRAIRALPKSTRELFEETSEKSVDLRGGEHMDPTFTRRVRDVQFFKDYKTEYPYPDRLVMHDAEMAVEREKGRSQKVMRVTYDEPKMVFAMDAFGDVQTEEFDRSGLPQRAVSGAQADAMRSSCANNMKQLGLVVKMFENEHEDYSPPSMMYAYPEYMTDLAILTCPTDIPGTDSYEYLFPATHLEKFSQIAARDLGLITEEQFNDPDRNSLGIAHSSLPTMVERNGHPYERNGIQGIGFNVMFADGHLEFITQQGLDERIGPYYALR